MKIINKRRSIRKFTDKAVSDDQIRKLLQAAMQAPSAGNQQPWEFIVVSDKSLLKTLSEMSPYANCVGQASSALILLGNLVRCKYPENISQDMSAAAENILLEAVNLDLGAVWLGVAPLKDREDFIRNLFDLPSHLCPFCVIPVGFPAEGQANRFISRFDEERIHYNKYELEST